MPTPPYLQILLGVLALSLSAQLAIDLSISGENIPITGQTLGVILVAALLPNYWGSLAVFLYLLLGFLGLPVLADGAGGMEKFSSGSAGFLYGFLLAALAISKLTAKGNTASSFMHALFINSIGTVIILVAGNAWLINKYGVDDGLTYGYYPFWKGGIIKIILGAIVIYLVHQYLGKKRIRASQ